MTLSDAIGLENTHEPRQCRSCGMFCGGGYHYVTKRGKSRYKTCKAVALPSIHEQRRKTMTIGKCG